VSVDQTAAATTAQPGSASDDDTGHHHSDGMLKLAFGAIGIVFGDIGTSPLYAFRETFAGHHKLALDAAHIMGVISLMFWSMMIVVTVKYVIIIMRADNKGEGGSLALLALVSGKTKTKRWSKGIILLGVFATALFYGDSMITPAVSVLSAVEGLAVAAPSFAGLVLPIVIAILIALFWVQKSGTARIGLVFGPIMLVYFSSASSASSRRLTSCGHCRRITQSNSS
jgi:KUP system potassium uptake protein